MNEPNSSLNEKGDLILFPLTEKQLTQYFGEPQSEEELLDLLWFSRRYPLIRSFKGLNGVRPILDSIGAEFCFAFSFHPQLISAICTRGFYPMATRVCGKTVLLIKLHQQRCLLLFKYLHISRNVKKKAKKYRMTVDTAFDACLENINAQHDDSWLYPPLVDAFSHMFRSSKYPVKLHSFELWDGKELVAGEVGFAVGRSYASLSGFYNRDSAGTIQLCATAKILERCGFVVWDLGMEIEYKLRLGARNVPRDTFLKLHQKIRQGTVSLDCQPANAQDIIKGC